MSGCMSSWLHEWLPIPPAPGEEVFEFVGVHVAIAVVAGVADIAGFAQLPDDDFHVSRDAVFFVDGDCELV